MILLADSGSTKTDWCIVDTENNKVIKVKTKGTNPFFQTSEEISQAIAEDLLRQLPARTVENVFFYGAGCTPEKQPILEKALKVHLDITGKCEVASDMLAAARSACGHQPGIVCILGTGSNSCSYDGKTITKNVSPLGFILGDEGSGAVLGKILVGDILKNQLPQHIIDRFNEKFHLTSAEIIERVYRQKLPNRFLASFVPFLEENIKEPEIFNLVANSFRQFLVRNVKQYDGWDHYPVSFVGSVAYFYQEPLKVALEKEGMKLGHVVQAPMEGLIAYHAGKI